MLLILMLMLLILMPMLLKILPIMKSHRFSTNEDCWHSSLSSDRLQRVSHHRSVHTKLVHLQGFDLSSHGSKGLLGDIAVTTICGREHHHLVFLDQVQENKVMMFSSTNCGYCDVAKETFASLGTQFKSLEVNKLGVDGAMMRNTLKSVTGERTVPAIFICGEPVKGGSNGLTELATSGRLSNMLERCCKGDATCGSWQHR